MTNSNGTTALLSDKVYNFLKPLTTIALPAASTLYFALAQIWSLPNADKVVATSAAVTTFLGALLAFSTRSYNRSDDRFDGVIEVRNTPQKLAYLLDMNKNDPEGLAEKSEVTLKVEQK